jgi:hypothetical protein
MARYARNATILAKIETTYGTDSAPTGTANAMLVSNISVNPLNAGNVDRALIRSYFGGSEQLLGTSYVECSFDVEMVGNGTAGGLPAFDPLLKACGFAVTTSSGTRVDYLPSTPGTDSVTIYYYDDGLLHRAIGCRGTLQLKATIGVKPVFSFRMLGIDGGAPTGTPTNVTYTAFKTPLVVTDTNTGDLTFNGTASTTGALAITSGTTYPSQGWDIDYANAVTHTPLLGGESIDITDRTPVARFSLDMTAAQESTFGTYVKAATLQSAGFIHGTATGYRVMVYAPQVQLTNWGKTEVSGRRLVSFDGRILPSTGNDELRIAFG